MPLHLLGKKSWHVYNSANVERVKRDEAAAEAREQAEEQRLQLQDAQDRTKILRGEEVEPRAEDESKQESVRRRDDEHRHKRRRLRGEDDTDRDIRWAREDAEAGRKATATLRSSKEDVSLTDRDGHIQLVPSEQINADLKVQKNAEVKADKARRKKQEEDQYTMRFSNAAGFKNNLDAPWYAGMESAKSNKTIELIDMPGKDVWGNEDPRRKGREQQRVHNNDPLAFMVKAQQQLKQNERDRQQWLSERAEEIRSMKRKTGHRHRGDIDELESFTLDANQEESHVGDKDDKRHRHRHHHRRRSRSRSRRRNR